METKLVRSERGSLRKQLLSRNLREQLCGYLGEDHSMLMEPKVVVESLVWPVSSGALDMGKGEGNKAVWAEPHPHLLPKSWQVAGVRSQHYVLSG